MSTNPGVTSAPSASIVSRASPVTCPTSVITPSVMATSAVRAGAPLPSTTVPPLTTRSCMSPLLQTLDDRDVGLTATFAHRLQPVPAAGAFELVQQCGHQPRAGCAEGMPERDRAAVDVDLGEVGARLLLPREHHGRERLVDLDEVDVVEAPPRLRQRVCSGRDGRGEHPHGVVASHREVMDAGARRETVLAECL